MILVLAGVWESLRGEGRCGGDSVKKTMGEKKAWFYIGFNGGKTNNTALTEKVKKLELVVSEQNKNYVLKQGGHVLTTVFDSLPRCQDKANIA